MATRSELTEIKTALDEVRQQLDALPDKMAVDLTEIVIAVLMAEDRDAFDNLLSS